MELDNCPSSESETDPGPYHQRIDQCQKSNLSVPADKHMAPPEGCP